MKKLLLILFALILAGCDSICGTDNPSDCRVQSLLQEVVESPEAKRMEILVSKNEGSVYILSSYGWDVGMQGDRQDLLHMIELTIEEFKEVRDESTKVLGVQVP